MKKEFSLIGLGIASWLGIISIAYTIRIILVDFFIIKNIKFPYIHLTYELFYNFIFLIGFYLFLNFLKTRKDLNYIQLLRNWIIVFILVQTIQFFYTYYIFDFIIENYHDNWSSFYDYEAGQFVKNLASTIGETLRYLGVGLLIYRYIKD